MDIDGLLPTIGAFGRYQKTQFLLLCIPSGIVASIIAFHSTFISGSPVHWCKVPALLNTNLSVEQRKVLSIPRSDESADAHESCYMYDVDYEKYANKDYSGDWPPQPQNSWKRRKCKNGWEYDTSIYDETLVMKFNLVCDDDWLPPFSKSMFYLGSFIGNFFFGTISDRYGRKTALLLTIAWMIAFTVLSAASINYYMYITLRFLVGFGFPSIYQIPFIFAIELMAPDKRTLVGNIIAAVFAFGFAVLAIIGYFVRNWFDLILATSLPFSVLAALYWILPESPRWLLSQNRVKEAEAVLRKAAKTNGKTLPPNFLQLQDESQKEVAETSTTTIWDLVKTPNMRKKLLIIVFCWPINAVVYTVVSFQASGLGVNEYVGFAIAGLVELPALVVAYFLMDFIGRRWAIFATMLVGGVACIITLFIPINMAYATITLAMIGKCGIAASFSVIYVFAGELNPTTIRSTAIGVYASAAGIALIACPYLLYLAKFGRNIPLVVCGILSVLGAISILFLPETLYTSLPQTVSEGEEFGKKFALFSCPRERRRIKNRRSSKMTNEIEAKSKENQEMINGSVQYTSVV